MKEETETEKWARKVVSTTLMWGGIAILIIWYVSIWEEKMWITLLPFLAILGLMIYKFYAIPPTK